MSEKNIKRTAMRLDEMKILQVVLVLTLVSIWTLGCFKKRETNQNRTEEKVIVKRTDIQGHWVRDVWDLYMSLNFSETEVIVGNHIDTIYRYAYQLENNNVKLFHNDTLVNTLEIIYYDTSKIVVTGIPGKEEGTEFVNRRVNGANEEIIEYEDIISYRLNPKNQNIRFYSENGNGINFINHGGLKEWLIGRGEELIFAINGGMFKDDLSPQGLYIEGGKKKMSIDTRNEGYGNFYLKPNGIFLITNAYEANILPTERYKGDTDVKYATQSGPMLTIDGEIHPAFNEDSKNVHIRNGVGVLPNGDLLFAMSKKKVNFHRLARFFQENRCDNALYLDGFVSKLYLPEKDWTQEEGRFGIIIAEIE